MQRMILVGSQQMLYKQFQLEARWAQIYAEVVFTIANTAVVIFFLQKFSEFGANLIEWSLSYVQLFHKIS